MDESKFEKQFVSYDVAVKLKELNYNEDCLAMFSIIDEDQPDYHKLKIFSFDITGRQFFELGFEKGWAIKAPLWSEVIDWFREKHNIHFHINLHDLCDSKSWRYDILDGDSYIFISPSEMRRLELPMYCETQDQARIQATLLACEYVLGNFRSEE